MSIELVVGLGNPGPRYADTRHNVGFRVAERLARRGCAVWKQGPRYVLATPTAGPRLLLPTTFMNRSGAAVTSAIRRFGLEPSRMLVVVDDVDLPLGGLRLRAAGGPGTHNGLRDICDAVGRDFPRLRLGVRGDGGWDDLATYVLQPFEACEREAANAMVARSANAVELAVRVGVQRAMSDVNRNHP